MGCLSNRNDLGSDELCDWWTDGIYLYYELDGVSHETERENIIQWNDLDSTKKRPW